MAAVISVDGRIESAADGQLRGWVWCGPGTGVVHIEIAIDGAVVAVVPADIRRDDLIVDADPPAAVGFAWDLPQELVDTGSHVLAVRALPGGVPLGPDPDFEGTTPDGIWGETSFSVAPVPEHLDASVREAPPEAPASAPVQPQLRFALEDLTEGAVRGWLRSRRQPPRSIAVSVAGVEVARAPADIARPDLEPHCHGFRIPLADVLPTPGPHLVTVSLGDQVLPTPLGGLLPVSVARPSPGPDVRIAQVDLGAEDGPRALIGRDGWLFPFREDRSVRWDKPLKPAALDSLVAFIAGWASAHRAMGVPYVLVVLPARERLEGQHLPPCAPAARHPAPYGQLRQALAGLPSPVELLDLLPPLRAAQASGPTSWRTANSLSARGAFVVAQEIIAAAVGLAAIPEPSSPAQLELVTCSGLRGDLAGRPKLAWEEGDAPQPIDPEDTPSDAFGEVGEVPLTAAFTATPAHPGRHLKPLGGDVRLLAGRERSGRVVLVGAALPPTLPYWLAECVHRLTIIDRLRPPLTEIELDAPDVVVHVVDEADFRLLV